MSLRSKMCADFLRDKTVFITGATGFLGLALVVKILLDAPCSKLFLLVRGGEKRFWRHYNEILPSELYHAIERNPAITVWDGDLTKQHLGLDDSKISQLKACVNVYIHAGSSINLRHSLPQIAPSIVDPSLELAEIALNSERLERFLYVSTAYANAHQHHLHQGVDTVISERVYSLRSGGGDSTDLELDDLRHSGTTPEYSNHKFPFPYAYAKHLTERLLLSRFQREHRGGSLLIVRPSIIGPAIREPFPNYEIPGSAPASVALAAIIGVPSTKFTFSSRFENPMTDSTIDEVPVDIVVNRVLMHLHHGSEGCVHAVAGASGRHKFATFWEKAMSERRIPWQPRAVWLDVDWHSPLLHDLARMFVVMGTSYVFEDDKVHPIWANMSSAEKLTFPLFAPRSGELDIVQRRGHIRYQLERWLSRKGLPLLLLHFLIRSATSGRAYPSRYLQIFSR